MGLPEGSDGALADRIERDAALDRAVPLEDLQVEALLEGSQMAAGIPALTTKRTGLSASFGRSGSL